MELKYKIFFIFIMCFFVSNNLAKMRETKHRVKVILYDLGGVLARLKSLKMVIRDVGFKKIFNYAFLSGKNPTQIQRVIFYILEVAGGPQRVLAGDLYAINNKERLPALLCEWLMGQKTTQEILEKGLQAVEGLDCQNFFVNRYDKEFVITCFETLFSSETLAKYYRPVRKAVKLKAKLAYLEDENGRPIVSQGLLSNFPPDCYKNLRKSSDSKLVFEHVRYEFISGNMSQMKPYCAIFNTVIQRLKDAGIITHPHEIVFIDNQEENVRAARRCGIDAIWLKNYRWHSVCRHLKRRGLKF